VDSAQFADFLVALLEACSEQDEHECAIGAESAETIVMRCQSDDVRIPGECFTVELQDGTEFHVGVTQTLNR
jgi:hypothetical protein